MGKLDVRIMKDLTGNHYRVLVAVEIGMMSHNYVPLGKVETIARKGKGKTLKILNDLHKYRLVASDDKNKKHNSGYRLTCTGYDILALKAHMKKNSVFSFGNQIGVGKESDVYVVVDNKDNLRAMKFHRLGRTCFRQVLNKRDYHSEIKHTSWIYLSRIGAKKEFAFMQALYSRKLPVPKPIAWNRHAIVMELLSGVPLCEVRKLEDPGAVYSECMELIVQLASWGVVHGDFNEFNLMLDSNNHITMIDFPQMVSTHHPDAEMYFNRDVDCIKNFFRKRFRFDGDDAPVFTRDVKREGVLDQEVKASGYNDKLQMLFDRVTTRLNMNIPETVKRNLPYTRVDDSGDEDDSEDEAEDDAEDDSEDGAEDDFEDDAEDDAKDDLEDDAEDDAEDDVGDNTNAGDSERSCEAGLQRLAIEDHEGNCGVQKPAGKGEETGVEGAKEVDLADLACGGSEPSDDCAGDEEDEEQGSSRSHQKGRSSASCYSASRSTCVLGPQRTEEIKRRIRSEVRKQKAREDARRLRKGIKSAHKSKLREAGMNDIKTSLSPVWY